MGFGCSCVPSSHFPSQGTHSLCLGLFPTAAETKYTWEEWTKRVHPPTPQRQRFPFATHSPTSIDLRYKTGKSDDWEREDFAFVKHSKIAFFSSIIGVVAVPALFK